MIQIIGIIELIIFYVGYFLKLYGQKKRGIITNQLGKGKKANRAIIIEKLLSLSSTTTVFIIFISAIINNSLFHNHFLRSIGLILLGLGTCLFIVAMITMKDNWRAGIPNMEKTDMVTQGIYRVSRNPAFLGFDLTYIGASIAYGNIVIIIMTVFTITMMHLQVLEEEKYLELTFGDSYIKYKNKVGRYFLFI